MYSRTLLRHFVAESRKLYGPHFVSYNVHGLIHLPADVMRFGPLDTFSCFPFENYLQQLKRKVRRSSNPLAQVVKRLSESSNCKKVVIPVIKEPKLTLSGPHARGPVVQYDYPGSVTQKQYKQAMLFSWKLSLKTPNNVAYLNDDSVVVIENFIRTDYGVDIVGRKFHNDVCLLSPPFHVNGVLKTKNVSSHDLGDSQR